MTRKHAVKKQITTFAATLSASLFLTSAVIAQEAPSHRSIGKIELNMPLSDVKKALLETNPNYVIEEVTRDKKEEVVGYAGVYFDDENKEHDVFIAIAGLDGTVLSIARDRLFNEQNQISKAVLRDSLLEKYGQTPHYQSGSKDDNDMYQATWFYDKENNSVKKMPRSQFCGLVRDDYHIKSKSRKSISYVTDSRDSCGTYIDVSAVRQGGKEGGVNELKIKVADQSAFYQDYLREEEMKKAEAEELKAKSAEKGIDL